MAATFSLNEMVQQSRTVLTRPSVATFERFEARGTLSDAVIYVAIASAITGIFGLFQGFDVFLGNIVSTILGFLIFTYLVNWIGKQRGGSGTLDHVAYTFALFWAPLSVLVAVATLVLTITVVGILLVPLLALAAIVANVYFAYLAVQSSMDLPAGGRTWSVLILAAVGAFLLNLLITAIVR